jgi:hypothetical protein
MTTAQDRNKRARRAWEAPVLRVLTLRAAAEPRSTGVGYAKAGKYAPPTEPFPRVMAKGGAGGDASGKDEPTSQKNVSGNDFVKAGWS